MTDLHRWASELLDQDRLALQDLCPLATSMMELRSSFTFGAYVRVKIGVHSETKDYPQLAAVFTRYIKRCFPDASFLTFRLQMNEGTVPHKDVQNTYLPSLVCNLSPGAPGGTWVEDSRGTHFKNCSDGEVRRGRIVQGDSYRISARKYWHAAVLEGDARIMLIAWVPAGWRHLAPADVASLKGAGFTFPDISDEDRAELSDWRGEGLVQSDIRTALLRSPGHGIWGAGVLRRMPPIYICLSSSDEEEEPAQGPREMLRSEATSVSSLPQSDDVCIETVLD